MLPLGGSLGEYSLNDLEEQPGENKASKKLVNNISGNSVFPLVKLF